MAKAKTKAKQRRTKEPQGITPEAALQFLEDMRIMASEVDEPTVSISLRVPGNVLRSVKFKAKHDGKKYQSLMIEYIRRGLKAN
ncbi:MAG: hypothetical protein HUU57_15125 [Bdellovibrio sp.]|nr:hypothetical protein [Bdellovibrio sp.]